MTNYFRNLAIFIVLISIGTHAFSQEFSAEVERSRIPFGDNVILQVTYTGDDAQSSPNFDALQNDFEILAIHPRIAIESINWNTVTRATWVLVLDPKRAGKLRIPSFSFNGLKSKPINIEVSKTAPNAAQDIYLETIIDKPTAYVREQIKVTYRLSSSVNLQDLVRADPKLNDAEVIELPAAQFTRDVDGVTYRVLDFSYAIKANNDGTLVIPELRWQVKYARNSTGSRYAPGRLQQTVKRTQSKVIRIKAIPDSYPKNAPWLPSTSVELTETWPEGVDALQIGEPVTRNLKLSAYGLAANELPNIYEGLEHENLRFYIDSPQLDTQEKIEGIVSVRSESAAIIASKQGNINLPSPKIAWWNTETDALEYATLPERNLSVEGENTNEQTDSKNKSLDTSESDTSNSNNNLQNSKLENSNSNWQLRSYIAAALLLISLAVNIVLILSLLKLKRSGSNTPNEPQVAGKDNWHALMTSLESNHADTFFKYLRIWIESETTFSSVFEFTEALESSDHHNLASEIRKIDASLYSTKNNYQLDKNKLKKLLQEYNNSLESNKAVKTLETF